MLKKNKFLLLPLAFVLSSGVVASSASGEPAGNETKGKYAYRNVYKDCEKRGEISSSKPPLNPDAKTQAQWERVFKDKEFKQFGCSTEWSALSAETLGDIEAYLWKHAVDSPSPAKCK